MNVRPSCRRLVAIGCLAPMIVLLAGPQAKAATRFKTFYLPRCCTFPWGITGGPDGNIWFTENDPSPGTGNNIGRLTPTGTLTEFPIPTGQSCPERITDGPDGNLWFVETCKDQIGRVTPTAEFTEFRVPQIGAYLLDIATGPDGNLWFTENYGNKIGRITPDGAVTEFYAAGSLPAGITAGPDGNLWYTLSDDYSNSIVRMSTAGVTTGEWIVPTADAHPSGITAGPDGRLWFTENRGQRIGAITTDGRIREFGIPTSDPRPVDITAGPDGKLWFTGKNLIGRVTTSGTFTLDSVPANLGPASITSGPDGNIWFTAKPAGQVVAVKP